MSKVAPSNIFTPGIRYMFLATFGFTIMQIFIKALADFHVFQLVFFRSSVTALLCVLYLKRQKIPLIGKKQKWLILRAICGIISMTLFFITIQRMPFGASVSLKYLSPIFTAIFAASLLKERIKNVQWLLFGIALIGVFLLKGFDTRIDTITFILGITGALFGGLVYVIIRNIGISEHPMVIVNYFMLSAAILSGIAMIPFWQLPKLQECLILLGIGIFGYFGQIYMTKAFQIELASRVAPVKYSELIYALFIGWIWWGEAFSLLSLIGIFLILTAMLLNLNIKANQ